MPVVPNGGEGGDTRGPRKPTVLLVDDCEITLAATAATLERAGYRVITRDRPAGCVALMLQEKPALVLLDVCMPTVAGDTLVKLFSKASPNSGTIILLYSALDEPLLRSKAKGSGAHGYISKTNDGAALLRAVRRWLRPSLVDTRVSLANETQSMQAARASSASYERQEPPQSSRMRDFETRAAVSGELPRMSGSYQSVAPTILFVDDDMLALSGYRRQLHGQPFEFDFALSGGQALRQLESVTPPRVIVCDLMMPKPDGGEVLRRALDLDISWGRRFVIVTGQPQQEAKKLLDRRFFGAVLSKPTGTDHLLGAIRTSLATAAAPVVTEAVR